MNKKMVIGIVVVLVAVLAWWMANSRKATMPGSETAQAPAAVDELAGLDSIQLENDMKAIDADLNQL